MLVYTHCDIEFASKVVVFSSQNGRGQDSALGRGIKQTRTSGEHSQTCDPFAAENEDGKTSI